jgi:hypothetical protein
VVYYYVFLVLVKLTQVERNTILLLFQIAADLNLLRQTIVVIYLHRLLSNIV